jgi:plastocyanin
MKALIILLFATSGLLLVSFGTPRVSAVPVPVNFVINATVAGWNSTVPVGPIINEFRGKTFTATVVWKDIFHNFAIYTKGFPATQVSTLNTCSLANTNGCLVTSVFVTSSMPTTTVAFTPTIPANDFTGPGVYEFYCQIHPTLMHGQLKIFKSPDINGDGKVNILDAAALAFAFDATPISPKWNLAADLNNNGVIDIGDAALVAFYFDQTI